jgi:phospholipid N-methyltransferase
MLNIFVFILEIILLLVLSFTVVLLVLWIIGDAKNKIPFVTTSSSILKDIQRALNVNDDSVVCDLGCGDGRILFYLSKHTPKAKYLGIENNSFAYILAKAGAFLNKKKTNNQVEILKKDFFKQDLSGVTHIFTYLYPNAMDELLEKFENEIKPGTRWVSLSFHFTNKQPIAEIDLERGKYQLGKKIYVYQF